jgi:UPF0716 protein FxsA
MLGRIVLFIVLVPLIELVLLSQLLHRTGLLPTLCVVLLTGIVGISLARQQGSGAWRAIQRQMRNGGTPSKEILDGVMILFAGAFLITPGLLTDIVGFSLLIPRIRLALRRRLSRWFLARADAPIPPGRPNMFDREKHQEQPGVRVLDPKSGR